MPRTIMLLPGKYSSIGQAAVMESLDFANKRREQLAQPGQGGIEN